MLYKFLSNYKISVAQKKKNFYNIYYNLFHLASDCGYWDDKAWENLVTEFAINTLEEIDREEWTLKFGKALQSQFSLYTNFSDDKVILIISSIYFEIITKCEGNFYYIFILVKY